MTASPPQVNGSTRPTMPVIGDWRPITPDPEPAEEQRNLEPPTPAVESDAVAKAQAEAIRAQAWADAEAKRIAAEAAAKAELAKAEEEARKLRIANDRAERKAREELAASEARIAESRKRKADADRAREDADRQHKDQQQDEVTQAKAVEKAGKRWRRVALAFYALCAGVALPVQMNAFYDPDAKYLLVAPVFIEVIALVALVGAAAAVTAGRPHWHYRLVAWAGALTAASINIVHGLAEYDPATAFGTALASIAGPGMWDLHEHGRIRKRDGKLSWRERRAARKAAKAEAGRKAAEAAQRMAEKEAADKAAAEAAAQLAADRETRFPDVWDHAVGLAAALGETTVTEAVWRRAHKDVKGTDPGDSPEAQQLRNAAARRMLDARADAPEKSVWKIQDAQVNPQVPPTRRRGSVTGPPVRGTRRVGDTPKFVDAARKQAAITAKNAAEKDPS
jgi:hypothetical protein